MTFAFTFQQPGTTALLQAIDNAALNADSGGAVFAFASKDGIDALLACPNVSAMLTHNLPFHLIVGLDAITNADALLCLSDKLNQFPGVLTVEAFYHEHPRSIFHPKFLWFHKQGDLCLVTGSGNLTLSGLGKASVANTPFGNWEAFTKQTLGGAEAGAVGQQIVDWLNAQYNAGTLCQICDERVRNRAMANARVRFTVSTTGEQQPNVPAAPLQEQDVVLVPLDGVVFETPEVLLREIPRNRIGQADVGRAALKEFFGYEGVIKTILIQHVSISNELESAHEILLFVNQSRNYRLELRAIADLGYEVAQDGSRMILVATKLDRRSFRYTVLPVTAPDYHLVAGLLAPLPAGAGVRPMREARVSPEELLAAWPNVPINLLPLNLAIPEP